MNRKEFGQLLAALRQDLDWTQFHLSEYADIDEAVISQIERGVKKFFEPELLFQPCKRAPFDYLGKARVFPGCQWTGSKANRPSGLGGDDNRCV